MREQVVIARKGAVVASAADELKAEGVPVVYVGELTGRPEVKDILAVMQLIVERSPRALLRVAQLTTPEIKSADVKTIDWRAGTITLRRTKGRREDVLPLPVTAGEAIAAHLKQEWPKTSNRAVFVRIVAPRDEPVGPDLVRKTIRQAYERAHFLTVARREVSGRTPPLGVLRAQR
ncbi:tyrosine-type recombinase/integrase [Pusillimonas sp. T7-7]|uniref:tyrosine-type recombinase/integrase n=1 Tax=Pusillimonas sp. (strain T7-7) TaxID=1007105 RepID=UPI000674D7AC|nr:tyrosine-type recombinase/integrase [Pusillimonas sp. T7-7]